MPRGMWVIGTGLLAALGVAAPGSGKTLATGSTYVSGSTIITTDCRVTNIGKKPIVLSNAWIQNYTPGLLTPASDSCTTAPLAPEDTCSFSGTVGVYGGGRIDVNGSTRSVRGHCSLRDAGGVALQILELR